MGLRLLRTSLLQPLANEKAITDRLEAVQELQEHSCVRASIEKALYRLPDFDRVLSSVCYQ